MTEQRMVPFPTGGPHSSVVQGFIDERPRLRKQPQPPLRALLRRLPVVRLLLPGDCDRQAMIDELLARHKTARNFDEWYAISMQLDELEGKNEWKADPQLDVYDYKLVKRHLDDMRAARELGNYKYLLYLIRTRWVRNLGNMGDVALYRHLFVGTKELIEDYIRECQLCLEYLLLNEGVDDRYLLGMLIQTRKNIGRTALVLSGGLTFGIFHLGVLVTLTEANLLPRIILGSLAGLIMALILSCHDNDETVDLLRNITKYQFNIFSDLIHGVPTDDPLRNLLNIVLHFIKFGTFFDTLGLKETMIHFVGDLTFREAYNRTGKILNVLVTPGSIHEQLTLLNYLTAPNCLIWLVVCALCSLPGVFPLTTIYEKNPKTGEIQEWNNDLSLKYVDGLVDADLPIVRLLEMFNVDHIIAVQVNPHVAPVLNLLVSAVGGEVENELSYKLKRVVNNVYDFVALEAIHYFQVLNELDVYKNLTNKAIGVLSQQYIGDITIFPEFHPADFTRVFSNPTPEFTIDFIVRGARALWPKLTVINNHCGVEFALDKAITALRGRIIIGALRLLTAPTHKHTRSLQAGLLKVQLYQLLLSPPPDEANGQKTPEPKPGVVRRNTTGPARRLRLQTRKALPPPETQSPLKKTKGALFTNLSLAYTEPHSLHGEADDGYHMRPQVRKTRLQANVSKAAPQARGHLPLRPHYPTQRIPFLHNPYYERLGKTFSLQLSTPKGQSLMTLPLPSHLRNLYIGLNRLKDLRLRNGLALNLASKAPLVPQHRHLFYEMLIASDNDDDMVRMCVDDDLEEESPLPPEPTLPPRDILRQRFSYYGDDSSDSDYYEDEDEVDDNDDDTPRRVNI